LAITRRIVTDVFLIGSIENAALVAEISFSLGGCTSRDFNLKREISPRMKRALIGGSYLVNEREAIFLAAKKSLAFFASCNIDAIAQITQRRRLYELIYITRGVIHRAAYELARNLKFRKCSLCCRMEIKRSRY